VGQLCVFTSYRNGGFHYVATGAAVALEAVGSSPDSEGSVSPAAVPPAAGEGVPPPASAPGRSQDFPAISETTRGQIATHVIALTTHTHKFPRLVLLGHSVALCGPVQIKRFRVCFCCVEVLLSACGCLFPRV
jgi:hypothetical protein